MYLWVVLTTFLAMIAAYFLPIRQDTHEMLTVPVAQARLIQMVAKHAAGKEFIRRNSWPYCGIPHDSSLCSAENEIMRDVGFKTGRLDDKTGFETVLPYGFVDNQAIGTYIYCMNVNEAKEPTTLVNNCRKSEDAPIKRLLVTYAPVPERWRTTAEGGGYAAQPSVDMIQAFREQFGVKTMAGFVDRRDGSVVVVNYEDRAFDVPHAVAPDLESCLNDYHSCLAIMTWQ